MLYLKRVQIVKETVMMALKQSDNVLPPYKNLKKFFKVKLVKAHWLNIY